MSGLKKSSSGSVSLAISSWLVREGRDSNSSEHDDDDDDDDDKSVVVTAVIGVDKDEDEEMAGWLLVWFEISW